MDSVSLTVVPRKSNNFTKENRVSTLHRSSKKYSPERRRREPSPEYKQSESSPDCSQRGRSPECNPREANDFCDYCGQCQKKTICITNNIPSSSVTPGPRGIDGAPGQNGAPGAQGQRGQDGTPGAPGQNGAPGAPGQNGAPGAPGAPGVNGTSGSGPIIGFSSLTQITLSTTGDQFGELVAVGPNASAAVIRQGEQIDLTLLPNIAPSIPKNSTITSLHAYFIPTTPISVQSGTITIRARLWTSPSGSNSIFRPTGVVVLLLLNGFIDAGEVIEGTAGLISVPITLGTRYILVFTAETTGLNPFNQVTGQAGGGLALA